MDRRPSEAEDENLAALEVATFLAAVTGARAPTEAVEAARVFASLPLIGVEDYRENPATGAVGGTRLGIADLPAPPLPPGAGSSDGGAPLWANANRSFVAALEISIHLAMAPARKLEELPTAIGIMRNLQFPLALIAIGRAETDSTWREARLIFAPSDAASRAGSASSQRMQVWARLPAITIPLLGDLLAGRADAVQVGGSSYLVRVANENPAAFCALLGKLLPTEIATDGPITHEIVLKWMTPEIANARGLV